MNYKFIKISIFLSIVFMELPITEMLEERLYELDWIWMSDAIAESEALERLIPKVKEVEEKIRQEAVEEFKSRLIEKIAISENLIDSKSAMAILNFLRDFINSYNLPIK